MEFNNDHLKDLKERGEISAMKLIALEMESIRIVDDMYDHICKVGFEITPEYFEAAKQCAIVAVHERHRACESLHHALQPTNRPIEYIVDYHAELVLKIEKLPFNELITYRKTKNK